MSRAAFDQAMRARSAELFASMGLETPGSPAARYPNSEGAYRDPRDLIADGAQLEDTLSLARPRNHFFDPQNGGRGLSAGAITGRPSPEWALEEVAAIEGQEFSITDATAYLYFALTGNPSDRRRSLGRVFQSLGHAIHHVQDMAQPQHVRNDIHLSPPFVGVVLRPSPYELYTNDRVSTTAGLPSTYPPLDLRVFNTSRSFWQNAERGLAEFTSHGFVSDDTNFRGAPPQLQVSAEYLRPAAVPCGTQPLLNPVAAADLVQNLPPIATGAQIWFIRTPVVDANLGVSSCNSFSSSYSIFTHDLLAVGGVPQFSLNRFNFDSAHQFLIPRAIAYSAGLLDHFFRGRMTIESANRTGDEVVLTIRNTSLAESELRRSPAATGPAEFEVWYDTEGGARASTPILAGARPPAGSGIASNGTHTLRFAMPAVLNGQQRNPFVLVFRGTVGAEAGVVGQVFGLEGGTLLVQPNYEPADGLTGSRAIRWTGAQWQAGGNNLVAGNVDWRGDESGEVLSWDGPSTRYFYPDGRHEAYSPRIYYQGQLLALAPGNVQGASIRTDATGRWLNVVTYSGGQLRVHSRPFASVYTNHDPYDETSNPAGWRLLYAAANDAPSTPMFFSVSGTQGQMMAGGLFSARFRNRLRVRIVGGSVSVEVLNARGEGRSLGTRSVYDRGFTRNTRQGVDGFPANCSIASVCVDSAPTCCLRRELDYDELKTSELNQVSNEVEYSRRTVVCADYRGEQEVLCTIEYEPSNVSRLLLTEERAVTRAWTATTSGGSCRSTGTNPNESTFEFRVESTATDSQRSSLKFGAVTVPLTGVRTERIVNSLLNFAHTDGSQPTGSNTTTETSVSPDARILYLDLRHDVAVYENRELRTRVEASGSGIAQPPQSYGSDYFWNGIANTTSEQVDHTVALIKDQRIVLNERSTQLPGQSAPRRMTSRYVPGGTPECLTGRQIFASQPEAFQDPSIFSSFFIHPRAQIDTISQGYAVDAGGRLAASQILWRRGSSSTYTSDGVWNFLSGGNLAELLPPGGPDPRFFPIGVID